MDNSLSERQKIEKIYHNKKYEGHVSSNNVTQEREAHKFFSELIGDARGLRILDFGCGNGWLGISLAKSGAEVYGIDISGELLKKARDLARSERISEKIYFMEMPGENLTFQENYFDLVLGSSILHHTELPMAIKSISRPKCCLP